MKLIKERLSKSEGLEETVRRQELVIERLESMINNYMKQKRSGGLGDLQILIRLKIFNRSIQRH